MSMTYVVYFVALTAVYVCLNMLIKKNRKR